VFPAWCRPPEPLLEREAQLEEADRALGDGGVVTLVGPGGVGTTSAGGALVRHALRGRFQRALFVRIDGCTTFEDILRALGLALDVLLPGDERGVREALVGGPPAVVLLDDADLAAEACIRATALSAGSRADPPPCVWILTAREPVCGTTVQVPPLSDPAMRTLLPDSVEPGPYLGLPLLAKLPAAPRPDCPWAAVDALPPGAEIVAELPMGLSDPMPPALAPFLVPTEGPTPRTIVRRSVREALGARPEPSSESLAAALRDRIDLAQQIATDVEPGTSHEDLLFYRTVGLRVADPDLAAVAAAAAARLYLRFFQTAQALELVRRSLQWRPPSPVAVALLRWLEGDALLEQGDEHGAHAAHHLAAQGLSGSGLQRPLAILARRCADRHAARGDASRARRWLDEARRAIRVDDDPVGWADTLRIAGDLSAQAGELVGAGALYDEASSTLERAPGGGAARAAVRLGQAALEIARGAYAQADAHLTKAEREAGTDPLLQAAVAYRKAELAIRQGKRDEARTLLDRSRRGFRSMGSLRGLLLEARLAGDLAALDGDRVSACQAWDRAVALGTRQRDLSAIHRLLRRLVVVEQEGNPGPHVENIRSQLDRVELLLAVR
jgi:predicted negative regulator of RcsB-dependent stress response